MSLRPRHGGNLNWAATLAGCPPSSIIDFSASLNPLAPPNWVKTEIQANLESLTTYPNPDYGSLRVALAQWHQLSPDWILPGNGAAELLTWAAWELSQVPVTYLLTPAFGDYQRALRTFGAKVQFCPLRYSPDDLMCQGEDLFSEAKDRGIIINNPHNPTGKQFSVAQLLQILDRFALVVVDEAFMDFLPPEQQSSLIKEIERYPNLVILRSLTKFYRIPGLRLGYAISHPDRLKKWQSLRDPWSVNSLAAKIGEKIPQDTTFPQQVWDWLLPTREKFYQGFVSLQGLIPYRSVANFLLVKTEVSSVVLQERLLKESQILIRDCLSFAQLGDRFFRVAVRTKEDNQRLLTALAKILVSI
ncbi:MAG: threonine-phosphate decarboxylase CobD [Microcystaceae cyanobacterium]